MDFQVNTNYKTRNMLIGFTSLGTTIKVERDTELTFIDYISKKDNIKGILAQDHILYGDVKNYRYPNFKVVSTGDVVQIPLVIMKIYPDPKDNKDMWIDNTPQLFFQLA